MGALYVRISARIRDGVAVAEARNGACMACFMALRPQAMAQVQTRRRSNDLRQLQSHSLLRSGRFGADKLRCRSTNGPHVTQTVSLRSRISHLILNYFREQTNSLLYETHESIGYRWRGLYRQRRHRGIREGRSRGRRLRQSRQRSSRGCSLKAPSLSMPILRTRRAQSSRFRLTEIEAVVHHRGRFPGQ